jgi:hypothetical protein
MLILNRNVVTYRLRTFESNEISEAKRTFTYRISAQLFAVMFASALRRYHKKTQGYLTINNFNSYATDSNSIVSVSERVYSQITPQVKPPSLK